MFHKYFGKHPNTFFHGKPIFIIDPNSFHAAAWRIALEGKTTEIFFFQFHHTLASPLDHPVRHILFGTSRHETGRIWISLQVHRLPWNGETAFHLRAYWDIFDILSKG